MLTLKELVRWAKCHCVDYVNSTDSAINLVSKTSFDHKQDLLRKMCIRAKINRSISSSEHLKIHQSKVDLQTNSMFNYICVLMSFVGACASTYLDINLACVIWETEIEMWTKVRSCKRHTMQTRNEQWKQMNEWTNVMLHWLYTLYSNLQTHDQV